MSFEPRQLCPGCGERKYFGDFYVGHLRCRDCLAAKAKHRWQDEDYRKAQIRRMKFTSMLHDAKKRARKLGVAYDLSDHRDELRLRFETGVCELSGVPFHFAPRTDGLRQHHPRSPSLDRRVACEGYTIKNVRMVVFAINGALGSWGDDEAAHIMEQWLKRRNAVCV